MSRPAAGPLRSARMRLAQTAHSERVWQAAWLPAGFGLRPWRMDLVPLGYQPDEAHHAIEAWQVLPGRLS